MKVQTYTAFALWVVLSLFFLFNPMATAVAAGQQEPLIRVGILTNQINVVLSADSAYELVDGAGKSISKFKPQEKISVSVRGSKIAVNGTLIEGSRLEVKTAEKSGDNFIEVNKRQYRGSITIHRTYGKSGLTVVNTLPIEQYLYGIITKEISPEWPLEAIKAQAVAARTYALVNMDKHQADGFDVCASTDCQVYGGRDSEAPRASKAVDDTKGIVMLYRGKLISAYFHSSGGGYTENSENVWGGYLPFLRAVPDFDQKSPHYKWEKKYTPFELEEILRNAGYTIGRLYTVELSKLTPPPLQAGDRGVSGRVKALQFTGSAGSVSITGTRLRSLLELPSTLFDIQVVNPLQSNIEFQITDSYGDHETKKVEVNIAPVPEKGLVTDKDTIRRFSYRTNEIITISGYGWGHGIGLSQWGAKAMAEKAPAGDTEYFKSILKHYYQGIEIKKTY
jgi:stage II sporulation protein D